MKGQQCSWRDMRKIKHILANVEKLKGEYDALMRCSAKSTRSEWGNIIEVMNKVRISEPIRIQPYHLLEIHRLSDEVDWQPWVIKGEKGNKGNGLTVVQLRSLLLAKESQRATAKAEKSNTSTILPA